MIELLLAVIVLIVVATGGTSVARRLAMRATAREFECALVYRRGRLAHQLRGESRLLPRPGTEQVVVDLRNRIAIVAGQEIVGADGVTLRVTASVEFEVADARLAVESVASYEASVHLAVQLALREEIGVLAFEELLARRSELGPALLNRVSAPMRAFGLEVTSVELRDVMPPGELRHALAEPALAAKQAQAALERARGETAALRSLANAAKMVERHPGLLELRTLQALADSPGTSTVLLPGDASSGLGRIARGEGDGAGQPPAG